MMTRRRLTRDMQISRSINDDKTQANNRQVDIAQY
jgi:hypothetical protein